MRLVAEANKYLSDQAPWKLKDEAGKPRMGTILATALQAISDLNTLLTPFLPHSAQQVHELLGGTGVWSGLPEIREVSEEGNVDYPVIQGDYAAAAARWQSIPIEAGTTLSAPTVIFRKLDPSVVDEELARLEEKAGS
jgi:methionyl-tRNA synthetase